MHNLYIIDDDEIFISVLQRRIEQTAPFKVLTFTSVEQALSLPSETVHGILLDMMLQNSSGLDGIESLNSHFNPTHLIMLSGYASVATTVEAMRRGATDFIAKPVGLQELLHRLQAEPQANHKQSFENITDAAKPMTTAQVEWEHIQRILLANSGNISATAEALGMHRRSLQRKLQKFAPNKS